METPNTIRLVDCDAEHLQKLVVPDWARFDRECPPSLLPGELAAFGVASADPDEDDDRDEGDDD